MEFTTERKIEILEKALASLIEAELGKSRIADLTLDNIRTRFGRWAKEIGIPYAELVEIVKPSLFMAAEKLKTEAARNINEIETIHPR